MTDDRKSILCDCSGSAVMFNTHCSYADGVAIFGVKCRTHPVNSYGMRSIHGTFTALHRHR